MVYVSYLGAAIQPLSLRVEQNTVCRLLRLIDTLGSEWERVEERMKPLQARLQGHGTSPAPPQLLSNRSGGSGAGSAADAGSGGSGGGASGAGSSSSLRSNAAAAGAGSGAAASAGEASLPASLGRAASSSETLLMLPPARAPLAADGFAEDEDGGGTLEVYVHELHFEPVVLHANISIQALCDEPDLQVGWPSYPLLAWPSSPSHSSALVILLGLPFLPSLDRLPFSSPLTLPLLPLP